MKKALRALVTVALLAVLAWRMDWESMAQSFAKLQVGWWLLAVVVTAVAQVISALRWQIIARPLGFERSLGQLTRLYFVGLYFNLILPTSVGGDVVRAWYLDAGSGKRLRAFVAVFLDRLSGLVVLLCMACVATWLSPLPLEPWIVWTVFGTAICGLIGVVMAPVIARFSGKVAARINQLRGAGAAFCSPTVWAGSTVLSLLVQVCSVVTVWLIGISIGAEVPWTFYWILVPMVSLLTLLPISTGGAGVREFSMVLFLAPLGVSEPVAVTLAVLWFAVSVTCGLFGGVVYLFGRFTKPETSPPALDEEVAEQEAPSKWDEGVPGIEPIASSR